jgi:hypothetical protein
MRLVFEWVEKRLLRRLKRVRRFCLIFGGLVAGRQAVLRTAVARPSSDRESALQPWNEGEINGK